MGVIAILIFISLAVALIFLAAFVWAVKSGQFDDTYTPSLRILAEEETVNRAKHDQQLNHRNLTPS